MTTTLLRTQITPIIALNALVLAALLLQVLGMSLCAALVAGGMLAAGLAAAVWGMSMPGMLGPQHIRWLLWPHAAAVISMAWLAALQLIPWIRLWGPYTDTAVDVVLLGSVTFFAELWLRGRRISKLPVSIALPGSLAGSEGMLRLLSPHHAVDIVALLCALAGVGLGFLLADAFCRHPCTGR